MAAPDKVLLQGLRPTLGPLKFRKSVTGPDECSFTAHDCPAIDTYTLGTKVPGYDTMRVVETDPQVVPGSLFDIPCRARGLLSGTSRVISRRIGRDAFGWDTLQERRMETKSTPVPRHDSVHPSHPKMFHLSGGEDEFLDLGDGTSNWVLRDRSYRGMIADSRKLISRKVSVNGDTVTPSDPIVVSLPDGWNTARKGQVSMPRIVVNDSTLTTKNPPTGDVPSSHYDPPSAPNIKFLNPTGSALTSVWPHHWTIPSVAYEELFLGAGVYLQTLTYEYVWPLKF